jgi:hypothetical protein
MAEILTPTVLTRRGETTHEDTADQAHRIEMSVWQTLVNKRQQRILGQSAPGWTSTPPDRDHTNALQAFPNAGAYNTLSSHRTRFVEFIAEPVETSEDIEAAGESFRKLRENLSEALKGVLIAFTRATSETSTLVSWFQALPHGTPSPESSGREWTEEKNQRRCDLVDKEIDGTISAVEKVELDQLQTEMLAYRRKVAPLPLESLRELHQELLRQASDKTTK